MLYNDPSGQEPGFGLTFQPVGLWADFFAIVLSDLLSGSNFHGSLKPRANSTGIWNDKFGVPYPGLQNATLMALGLPTAGCDFGACGGIPGEGLMGNSSNFTADPALMNYAFTCRSMYGTYQLACGVVFVRYGPPGTPVHGEWKYGNFCGAGGGPNLPIDELDDGCAHHDQCYYDHGQLTMWSNWFGPFHPGLQACNQALCDAASRVIARGGHNVTTAWSIYNYFTFAPRSEYACH